MTTMIPAKAVMNRMATEVGSALPDAPVVPYVEPTARAAHAVRSRATLARLLERTARAIEPPTACTSAR
jgi:hypothetical protein